MSKRGEKERKRERVSEVKAMSNSVKRVNNNKRPCALVFGDSITQFGEVYYEEGLLVATIAAGWISLLRNRFARRFDIMNRGYSGYNSRWAVCIADRVFTAEEYVFVTIFFGANDAANGKQNPKQSVPVEEYRRNIRDIVTLAKRKTKHVIVIAPPPVDSRIWVDRSNESVEQFARAAMEVAKAEGCDFINLYDKMTKSRHHPFTFLSDGLHLNAKGQIFLAKEIIECVDRRQRSGDTSAVPSTPFFDTATDRESNIALDFPSWRAVSNDEPAKSLSYPHQPSSSELSVTHTEPDA